jgi:hypothetical protein
MQMGSVFGASQEREETALRDYLAQLPPSQHQGVVESLMQRGGKVARMIGGEMASLFKGGGMLNPTPAPFEPSMQGVMDAGNFAAEMVNPAPGIDRSIQAFGEGRYVDAAAEGIAAMPMVATFAGRGAKTANMPALQRAKQLAESGADRRAIWEETGWFKGVDGKWRFEIDDSAALSRLSQNDFLRPSAIDRHGNVESFLEHPQLLDAYSFGPMRGQTTRKRGDFGSYTDETDTISVTGTAPESFLGTSLHELQHAIQAREAFAMGGSPAQDAYQRLAGEVEARNVQTRMNFTPEQRRAQAPWETQDVPDELQIVRKR